MKNETILIYDTKTNEKIQEQNKQKTDKVTFFVKTYKNSASTWTDFSSQF